MPTTSKKKIRRPASERIMQAGEFGQLLDSYTKAVKVAHNADAFIKQLREMNAPEHMIETAREGMCGEAAMKEISMNEKEIRRQLFLALHIIPFKTVMRFARLAQKFGVFPKAEIQPKV